MEREEEDGRERNNQYQPGMLMGEKESSSTNLKCDSGIKINSSHRFPDRITSLSTI